VVDAVAIAAEAAGFRTLWIGEHVVMVDRSTSRYPYAPDGRIAVPADADWLDPMIALSFAAAATRTIRIATGVLLRVNLADPAHARERITRLRTLCKTAGRDPSELDIAVALAYPPRPRTTTN
jgi:alkanesulfonate monooxygenase SsuD/methylene tetrahydromethanopterin reductase-like flavin-dependent oxidoreductase (luciferase family)